MPPPLGPAEFSEIVNWLLFMLVVGIIVVALALLIKYLLGIGARQSASQYAVPVHEREYEELLRELIGEIKALRKDITELRRELRE